MSEEKPYRDFEDWYTEVFGGHITKEQADDSLRIAYDYYVDNRRLTVDNAKLNGLVEKYRQAVDKCLHITFMGGGCEVHTIVQYATLVDDYLTDVEGLAKW